MSSLAKAVNTATKSTDDDASEVRDNTPVNASPTSKSDQDMDTDGSEELSRHLESFINAEDTDEERQAEEISFGGDHTFFRPPSFARAFVASDLRTPDLPHIFWASIRIPVPPKPVNATDAMFDALDEFVTKMKEADRRFTVFPHNLSKYGTMDNLPHFIDDPEDLPTEVDDWLVYFPQAKPRYNGGDVYTTALIGLSIPLGRIRKERNEWFRETRYGLWQATIQTESPVSVGWLLFSTNFTNTDILKSEISKFIDDIPVGLRWKMISLGTQGKIPPENQVRALHVYVDEMDVTAAKLRLTALYEGNASVGHRFPLHMRMRLVPEVDSVLNTQGRRKIDKLRACQATWTTTKLITLKTWEIKFLDEHNRDMGMSLRDAMMAIKHPANPRFSLFHSIDKHWKDDCYVVTCLKSADSLAHAMIAALLPYVKWTLEAKFGKVATSQVPKWFKPTARLRAADAYWDPKEECVRNKSDDMLNVAMADEDGLYWEAEAVETLPAKQKKIKVDDESVTDSVSTVKTAISSIQQRRTNRSRQQSSDATPPAKNTTSKQAQTVASQVSTITQLTEQVSILQLAHNEINSPRQIIRVHHGAVCHTQDTFTI